MALHLFGKTAPTVVVTVFAFNERRARMKVLVAFDFEGVDPDSPEADEIVAEITESCETMRIGFDANACWVDNAHSDDAASYT